MKKIFLTLITVNIFISCNKKDGFTDEEVCKLLTEMTENDQKYRNQIMDSTISNKAKDSFSTIQNKIDRRNTELLIEIINQKGWPNADSLNCEDPSPTILIFRHADKKYFDTIQKLIDIELKKGNLGGLDHMFIDNHLKGRPDFNFKVVEEDSL